MNKMSYSEIISDHYEDINNLSTLLRNYIEIYRLLISSAAELNSTSSTKKGELKKAIERIDSIGDIIDDLLKGIKKCEGSYVKYCTLKNEAISIKNTKGTIFTEIHDELDYHND